MLVETSIMPTVVNDRLCGKVESVDVRFKEVFSKIGSVSARRRQLRRQQQRQQPILTLMRPAAGNVSVAFLDALQLLLKPLIKVAADTTLRIGAPIPVVENLMLANHTAVNVASRSVRIKTDLTYSQTPSTSKSEL